MSPQLHLSHLEFVAGPDSRTDSTAFELPQVTLFVGPNNSGKSLALREIETWCRGGNEHRRVLKTVRAALPKTPAEGLELIEPLSSAAPVGQLTVEDHVWVYYRADSQGAAEQAQINLEAVRRACSRQDESVIRNLILRGYVLRLDGRTRFALADPQPTGDLQGVPQNHLWALFADDAARDAVRRLTSDAFGLHFVIDPTGMTAFRVRMSSRPPESKSEEQGLDAKTRKFHAEAAPLAEFGDGVQAFTGLALAVRSAPHRVLLIDEPEAFLHPSLARRLGHALSELVSEREATLIAATHSADFVMGCLETSSNVAVVRLTYDGRQATARTLPRTELKPMMQDPLLRSTGALRGLFYRAVVVTEGESDRAFYDEINRRLVAVGRGVTEASFVAAQNWQTTERIAAPLRRLGIPAAIILDLDSVTRESTWPKLSRSVGFNQEALNEVGNLRANVAEAFRDLAATHGQDASKREGIGAISGQARVDAERLLTILAGYGVFVLPVGELERWLPHLDGGPKRGWLLRIFERLGSDPSQSEYVIPSDGDVWSFLDSIETWVADPDRAGIPDPSRGDVAHVPVR